MCGIFGYIGVKEIDLKAATDVIAHRGPDAEGFLGYDIRADVINRDIQSINSMNGAKVLLGFRRLSIIDLSHAADQPFSLPDRGLHITFNGEIYNYLELRKELTNLGHTFRTDSDTEVLLHAYAEWGQNCVMHFNGMWAFSILDEKQEIVFCSRDRFGIKPLYYAQTKDGFYWASEIKQFFNVGVKKQLNEAVLRDFLDRAISSHTSQTFFQNIFSLQAGHNIVISLSPSGEVTTTRIKRYWKLTPDESYHKISYEEAKAEFTNLFASSIKLRFRSDVPVGSCLSGGLDSSSIVCQSASLFQHPIHTFISRFDSKKFDESHFAKLVPDKYPHVQPHFCSLSEKIVLEEIDQIIYHQDEPFGTFSIIAQWEVMKLAKKNNVTVLLDGQGGDELLGGYRKYYAFFLKEQLQRANLSSFARNIYYLIKNKEFDFFHREGIFRYLNISGKRNYLSDLGKKLTPLASIGLGSVSTMNDKTLDDIEKFSYPALLRFEDRNSMAHSIEARVPYMDHHLAQFVFSLPATFKIKNGYTKALLRDSMKDILPDEIRLRISKLGFATPQSEWMMGSLHKYFSDYFNTMDNPYLNNKAIANDFKKYPASDLHSWDFSRYYIFSRWYKLHFQ